MPDPDWPALYASEVLPAMEAFAQGPPMPVYFGMGVVVLVGVLMMAFGKGSVRVAGVVPLFLVGFVAFMALGGQRRIDQPARFRVGTVMALTETNRVQSTTRGVDTSVTVYQVQVAVSRSGHFGPDGAVPLEDAGTEELVLDESLFRALAERQEVTLVSYPGAEQAVAFALVDGVVVRGRHL
ncbi:MAG: hypothetical protein H6734_28140 [Alphaproteobacteria bacterium]|nr:hypothetical protein [Alphaproteobacteria bacterium]